MVPWLVPIALFWPLAALYLGGAPITMEGGGGVRQASGLLLHFVSYLGIYALLRAGLSGLIGPVLGGVVVPIVLTSILLPVLAKLAFGIAGVRLSSVPGSAAE